jgi:hypothetical protein
MAKKDTKELVARVRKRFKVMSDYDRENRQKALDDLRFLHVPGEQWDPVVRKERGDLRPMYEFNKLRITVKRIVNDMRANRPQGKVRAVEDGDTKTAKTIEGLVRNLWNVSDGDTVIDQAAEYQVGGGMGAWRIVTEYADDEAFEQTISIKPIRNPFCLYADPASQDLLKRDAMDWIVTDKISKEAFEKRWPKAEVASFEESEFDDDDDWEEEDKVRICEYWWKEPTQRTLCLLSNGATVDADSEDGRNYEAAGLTKVRERVVNTHKIMMCIVGGTDKLLEPPTEWAGSEFPFVLIYGESVVIDGKTSWFGLTRFGKDAQRSYNYSRTNAIESVALAPQAKWWATAEQAAGLTNQWAEAHKVNLPFMLYNPDAKSPGPPQRMGSADVPMALVQEMQMASEDIKAVTGIYDASLGASGNETSGRAINARQRQGEIATFNYMDNMAKGIRRTWEILIDLIPKVYDTERSVRILGHDGAEDYQKVNAIDPATGNAINDLRAGKYDVTVSVGPSFATLRQEAAEVYGEMARTDPMMMQIAGDLIHKSTDYPYSEQIAERYAAMLPPQIQQMNSKGKDLPPEVKAALMQVDQAMQQVQQHGQMVEQAAAEVGQQEAELTKQGAAITKQVADLNVKQAQFDASVEKQLAQIMKAEAALMMKAAQQGADVEGEKLKTDRESLSAEVQTAVAGIQDLASQFQQQAVATLSAIQAQAQPGVILANPPKRKMVRVRRVNGELVGESQEVME